MYISRWGWSFLSDILYIFYGLNAVWNTPMDLLLVIAAFEGWKQSRIDNFFQRLKDLDSGYESTRNYSRTQKYIGTDKF